MKKNNNEFTLVIFIIHVRGLQIDGASDGLEVVISLDDVIADVVMDILMMLSW
jgi:hypothetical protein